MTLRIMLLGLVASLGFELPNGVDVSSWARAGSEWARARMLGQSGPEVGCKLALEGPSDCQRADESLVTPVLAESAPAAPDEAFETASAGMIADLKTDLLAARAEEAPADEVAPVLALVEATVAPLEAEAVGCLALSEGRSDAVAVEDGPALGDVAADEAEPVDGSRERLDRVSAAVRLTREAVQAWAAVLQPAGDEAEPTR